VITMSSLTLLHGEAANPVSVSVTFPLAISVADGLYVVTKAVVDEKVPVPLLVHNNVVAYKAVAFIVV